MDAKRVISALIMTGSIVGMFVLSLEGPEPPAGTLSASFVPSLDSIFVPHPQPLEPALVHSGTVGKNSSFFDIMVGCGFTPKQIDGIARAAKPYYDFRKIRPGQSYEIFRGNPGEPGTIKFTIDEKNYIEVDALGGEYSVVRKEYLSTKSHREASGLITQSLFATLIEKGLPVELGVKIADIYAWDIDFFSQIRKNDYFRVIYEEITMLEGPQSSIGPRVGDIIACEFNTSGEIHYAVRFENGEGNIDYYDEKGRSLRKALLRAPLNYSRISSNFSSRRLHPLHKTYQPHYGVDYAAPVGTPVLATGDGTVMEASRTASNGKYVQIRHNGEYTSYYLHLSRFAKGIKGGARVRQGQVIGYVGQTGYATGPHLDYRIKKSGRFVNPRSLKLPPAEPVSDDRMADFRKTFEIQTALLEQIPVDVPRAEYYAKMEDDGPYVRDIDERIPANSSSY